MAVNATATWRVRTDGNELNGGGFDPNIAGAGDDYTDQTTAEVSVTDLATSGAGSATLTSATASWTSAMIGNCVRISSGTNFQTGYYFITNWNSSTSVDVDRSPTSGGAGSGGTGRLGGSFVSIKSLASGGSSSPTIASPLVAGNTIYVRGAGTDDPSGTDYTESYFTFAAGTTADGAINLIGYNGRPHFACSYGVFLYQISCWRVSHIKLKATGSTDTTTGLVAFVTLNGSISDCIIDSAGVDLVGLNSPGQAYNNYFKNSGSTSAGTSSKAAIVLGQYGNLAYGNVIDGWRGAGIYCNGLMGQAHGNIVANCKAHGIYFIGAGSSGYRMSIVGNTCYKNTGAGIYISNTAGTNETLILNNILTENTTYGIDFAAGTATPNDALKMCDYNAFYLNTTDRYHLANANTNDITLTGDPFTNAATGDWSLDNTAGQGADCRDAADPGIFRNATTTAYRALGAVQNQGSGGGGSGGVSRGRMI